MNIKKSNQSSLENMLEAFQSNELLVSEPRFFSVPVSGYFAEVEYRAPVDIPSEVPFVVDRSIGQEIMARFMELNVHQSNPAFFGILVADYLAQYKNDIWQQILDETNVKNKVIVQVA